MATKSSRLAIILGLNSRGFNAGLTKAGAKFKAFGASMRSTGAALSASVTGPLALLSGVAGKSAVDFEFAMAKVKAVSGATASQMKELEGEAKRLGATTAFSAKEVATLQLELSKLGFPTGDIVKMEEGVLALAQAFDNELGDTAEVVGTTLRQFGLEADQAGRVTDVMATAFGNSALDLERFKQSMSNVGPVARAAGLNLEDTTALLGILANNGITGADAGTKLKIALTEIRSAGLDVESTLQKVIAGGYDFEDSLDLLGKRAQIVAPILSSAGDKSAELAQKLYQSDGAAKAAQAELDNTAQGALKRMQSALEALAISFGELLLPKIEQLAGFVGALAQKFESLDAKTKALVLQVGGLAAAVGPTVLIMGRLLSLVGTLSSALGFLLTPWGLVAAAVVAAVYLIIDNWQSVVNYFTGTGQGIDFLFGFQNAFNVVVQFIVDLIEFLVNFWERFGEQLTGIGKRFLDGVLGLFEVAFEAIARLFGTFSKLLEGDWRGFFEGIVDTALTLLQFVVTGVANLFGTIGGLIDTVAQALGFEDTNVEGFIRGIGDSLKEGLDDLKFDEYGYVASEDYFSGFSSGLSNAFSSAGGFFAGILPSPGATGGGSGGGSGGPSNVTELLASLDAVDTSGGASGEFLDNVEDVTAMEDKVKRLEDAFKSVGEAGKAALDGIGNGIADAILGTQSFGESLKAIGTQLIKQLISIAIGYAITSALSPFAPENLATAGTAGAGKAAAAPGLIASLFSGLTGFKDGGAVLGPTLALIGENPASKGEFVIPFERVGSFVSQFQDQAGPVIVNGRIRANDIHLSNRASDAQLQRRRVI